MEKTFEHIANQGLDRLFLIHQEMWKQNRNESVWGNLVITQDEIDKRFMRVSDDAACECGELIKHHTYSEQVLALTGHYLIEMCDGKLGHT